MSNVMKISISDGPKPQIIKVRDMPKGTIGKVTGSFECYVMHTNENGDYFIRLWPNAHSPSIQAVPNDDKTHYAFNWDVELLPNGTKITLEF